MGRQSCTCAPVPVLASTSLPTMGLGDAAGEIQPQPLVAVAGAGGVGVEELPGLVQGFGREAWAGIGDGKGHIPVCLADGQRDGATGGSIAHGVVQHVFKCTAEFRAAQRNWPCHCFLQNKVELRRAAEGVGRIRQRGNKGMAVSMLAGGGYRAHTAQGGKVLLGAVPCPPGWRPVRERWCRRFRPAAQRCPG